MDLLGQWFTACSSECLWVHRAVYVHYRRTNGSWFQVAKLIVSPSPNYARLGTAVGIDRKGVRILAGAPGATGNTTIKGEIQQITYYCSVLLWVRCSWYEGVVRSQEKGGDQRLGAGSHGSGLAAERAFENLVVLPASCLLQAPRTSSTAASDWGAPLPTGDGYERRH